MSPIDLVLSHLDGVRKGSKGQYRAQCPAHGSKGGTLSVRESPDGAVLIHCFAGCEAAGIVAGIGLELHDLFPPREVPPGSPKRLARLLTPAQALEVLADDARLVAVAAGNVGHGVALTPVDTDAVIRAAGRINWIRHEALGGHHA